jgi:hypothetical protein
VLFLKREEALSLLKEIATYCDGLNESLIAIMPPDADDVLSHGYQLHIKSWVSHENSCPCLKPIVAKRGLEVKGEPEKDLLVIYRPMK